ncbi:hypothetical protein BDV34DRAFT_189727 [Aspergillus parasiticus]|uniref:Uncharacterized protein n=1 Tax=Aspergillus parasiticus TaxID=5067 RepID=A0A5N6DV01_ASPPA|nr:hypothetical protein BDV34DRAFT_189727 [Aspergillus parasiticus]
MQSRADLVWFDLLNIYDTQNSSPHLPKQENYHSRSQSLGRPGDPTSWPCWRVVCVDVLSNFGTVIIVPAVPVILSYFHVSGNIYQPLIGRLCRKPTVSERAQWASPFSVEVLYQSPSHSPTQTTLTNHLRSNNRQHNRTMHLRSGLRRYVTHRCTIEGESKPEYRLPLMIFGTAMLPISPLLYGWSAEEHVHWIVASSARVSAALVCF